MDAEHNHTVVEGIILDAAGHDSGERWLSCPGCGLRYEHTRRTIPFPVAPLPAMAAMLTKVRS